MPTKRQVLEHLKRDELLAAADAYELTIADRRQRALLVDALARSRQARLEDVLVELPRVRLKEICRELGLDDGGRAKARIAARIAGNASSDSDGAEQLDLELETAGKETTEPETPETTPEVVAHAAHEADEHGKLTREQLERDLWSAADILRGSIDSSD